MDVLIFIGIFSSFFYSLAGMITVNDPAMVHKYMFFETTATIITLVLLGNLIEHLSIKRTTSAINDLSALQPEKAKRRMIANGIESFEDVEISLRSAKLFKRFHRNV